MCPICAAPNTPIATPSGERPIAELAVGDLVYSVDGAGIVTVPIVRAGSTSVVRHSVVRLVLESGSVLEISAGHPTADGRRFSDLAAGDKLDPEHAIVSAEIVAYGYDRTYDILPESSSGAYFAGGALVGSTLAR
jgi:Hint domain